MKQQVVQALQNSTINNQQVVKQAQLIVNNLSQLQNYCLVLMQIVDDSTIDVTIRLAALIQLKNNIQRRWLKIGSQVLNLLTETQKQQIKQTLLTAMIRCQTFQPLLRIYQTIVTLVVIYECKQWMPTQDVINVLQTQPENLNVTVLFVQSVEKAFSDRLKVPKDPINLFNQDVVGLLYKAVTGVKKSIPLIYLVMKAMQKAFKIGLSETTKQFIPIWMPLIKQVIDYEDQSLKVGENVQRNSLGFYLSKAKKWACKIIEIFFRVYCLYEPSNQNMPFMKEWASEYAASFVQSVVNGLTKPNLTKTYFFIFKILTGIISKFPSYILPYAQKLIFEIIPHYTKLVPEDQQLAKNDPLELFKKQQDSLGLDGDPKYAAFILWSNIVQIDSVYKKTKQQQGPYLRKSLQWIYQSINSGDLLTKQLAMNLFCRSAYVYIKFEYLHEQLIMLIQKSVLINLESEVVLVRARAIEVLQYYGKLEFSSTVILQQIVEVLYKLLTEKDQKFVNIKAAEAFISILIHDKALQMIKPYLKDLLQVYTKLITENEIQTLVAGLESIIAYYGKEIIPYSIDLIGYLTTQYLRFVSRDIENCQQQIQDGGQYELAAHACLDVIRNLLSYSLPEQVLEKIQPWIIQIVQETMIVKTEEYYEGMIKVLSEYLLYSKSISQQLWFFYPIILYSITGLPPQLKTKQLSIYNPKQSKILNGLPSSFNAGNYDISAICIRNFITKNIYRALQQQDMFGFQMLRILFIIFIQVLKPGFKSPGGILNSAAIMLVVLETEKQEPAMIHIIWNLMATTTKQIKTITGKKIALQLFCMSLYNNCQATFQILNRTPKFASEFLKSVFKNHKAFKKQYQLTRVILGVGSILLLLNKPDQILELVPLIMQFLFETINILMELRFTLDPEEGEGSESESEIDADEIVYWTEERRKARTKLDDTDAADFILNLWQHIESSDPQLHSLIVSSYPKLNQLLNNTKQTKQMFNLNKGKNRKQEEEDIDVEM